MESSWKKHVREIATSYGVTPSYLLRALLWEFELQDESWKKEIIANYFAGIVNTKEEEGQGIVERFNSFLGKE